MFVCFHFRCLLSSPLSLLEAPVVLWMGRLWRGLSYCNGWRWECFCNVQFKSNIAFPSGSSTRSEDICFLFFHYFYLTLRHICYRHLDKRTENSDYCLQYIIDIHPEAHGRRNFCTSIPSVDSQGLHSYKCSDKWSERNLIQIIIFSRWKLERHLHLGRLPPAPSPQTTLSEHCSNIRCEHPDELHYYCWSWY